MTAGEMAAPSEAAAKVVLEGLQELPQSAVAWGQDEVESFVDFDVQAALSSLTFSGITPSARQETGTWNGMRGIGNYGRKLSTAAAITAGN